MNKKNKHLDCYTDNLAFPEVHVEDVKTENDENENNNESGVIFDNLAIPEIKIKSKKRKREQKKRFSVYFQKIVFFISYWRYILLSLFPHG